MENFMDDSMLDYSAWKFENHSKPLETGLVGVETGCVQGKAGAADARREHSIKGAARIVGLPIAVGLAHAMEDLLSDALKGKLVLTNCGDSTSCFRRNDLYRELAGQSSAGLQEWLNQHQNGIEVLQKSLEEIGPCLWRYSRRSIPGCAGGALDGCDCSSQTPGVPAGLRRGKTAGIRTEDQAVRSFPQI